MPVVDYLGILRAVLIQIQRWLVTLTGAKNTSGISPFSIPRARQADLQTSSDAAPGSYEIKRYKERPRASYKQLVMQMVNVTTNISILGYRFSSFLIGSMNIRWLSAINCVTWCANDFDGYFERKKSEAALKEMLTLFRFAIAVLWEFCDPDLQLSFLSFYLNLHSCPEITNCVCTFAHLYVTCGSTVR